MRERSTGGRTASLILALGLCSSCGAGVAGVAASSGDSGGGNSAASIANLQVPVSRTVPARIVLELSDREGESVRLDLGARVPLAGGGMSDLEPLTAVGGPGFPANGATVAIPGGGQPLVLDLEWRFPEESFPDWPDDGRYVEGLQLVARLANGAELVLGDDELLSVGNDAPVVTAVTPVVDPSEGEAAGIVRIQVNVEDSSDDVITVAPEFDVQGDVPDASWQPATGFGLTDVRVSRDGTALDFFWDTDTDLADLEREVVLRFTPRDFDGQGNPVAIGLSRESIVFRVDNNAAPIVQLDSGPLILNPDERRGIPIPFRVIDEEGDLVEVIFQWRREGEEFPSLDRDGDGKIENAEVDAVLADEDLRQEHHVCTPYPHYAKGRVVPIDENTVRLPELASSESWILASGIVGKTLELLRPSSIPAPITPTWRSNPLVSPIVALPIGDSLTALVLDIPGSGRLREIELATGEIVREVATLGPGIPSTMAFERREKAVLVALDDAGTWRIERVELATGVITELIVSDGTEPAPVRGLASLGTNVAVFTAGTSLFLLDYRDPSALRLGRLLTGLASAWGVVVDPLPPDRIYLAERDANRVLAVELDSHAKIPVVVKTAEMQPGTLDAPEALALERLGSRMLVVTSAAGGGQELLGLDLGALGGNVAFPIGATTPEGIASVATGPDDLRLLCLSTSHELLLGTGLEQRRNVVGYHRSFRDATVGAAFVPTLRHGQTWRIRAEPRLAASPLGSSLSFAWDSHADLPSGGPVYLRVLPRDEESGSTADGVAPKTLRAALDVPSTAYPTPHSSFAAAAGDLDSDGDLDLVSANVEGGFSDRGNLLVFLQSSPGKFVSGTTLGEPMSTRPAAVAAADLDADGDLDVVSANDGFSGVDNLTIFFQTEAHTIDQTPLVLGGSGTTANPTICVVDFDSDGDLDLVSANDGSGTVTALLQRSAGQFDPVPLDLGGYSGGVAAADLDSDGAFDLVSLRGNLTTFFQRSPGTFIPHLIGTETFVVAPADLDSDGDCDLVTAGADSLAISWQRSPGGFDSQALVLGGFPITELPLSVACADLDSDSDLDIVSANVISRNLTAFFQRSAGIFDPEPLDLLGASTSLVWFFVAVADLDSDGSTDLVYPTNFGSHNLNVQLQHSPGTFDPTPLVLGGFPPSDRPSCIAATDLDSDGQIDLVSTNLGDTRSGSGNNLTIFWHSQPGSFNSTPLVLGGPDVTDGPLSVAAADLDADGDLDLVSANEGGDDLTVFSQMSPGTFEQIPLGLGDPLTTDGPVSVIAADLDSDGALDVVSANRGNHELAIFFQGFSSAFEMDSIVLDGPGGPDSVAAADFDLDGDLDLVSTSNDNLVVVFQNGQRAWSPVPLVLGAPGIMRGPTSVAAADLDADGNLDLVSTNTSGTFANGNVTVFFQDATGSFASRPLEITDIAIAGPRSVVAADFDLDGQLDLASANSGFFGGNEGLVIFFQSAPRRFRPNPVRLRTAATSRLPVSIAAADLDLDGELDLVSANSGIFDGISSFGDNLTVFWSGR